MTTLNKAQEAFALLVASGTSAAAAYRECYPKASRATAETKGPALARDGQVRVRIRELKVRVNEKAAERFALDKMGMLNWLKSIMDTPVGEISERHKLCQEYSATDDGIRVKMPGKLEAAEKIIKMLGWNEPEEVTVNHGVSPEAIEEMNRIFGRPLAGKP